MSNDVVRSRVDILFPDADMFRIEQSLADHVVSTLAAVGLAVGAKLTERQGSRRGWNTMNSLPDDVAAAVVVIRRTLVARGWLPRLTRYWLAEDVETKTLQKQSQNHTDAAMQ